MHLRAAIAFMLTLVAWGCRGIVGFEGGYSLGAGGATNASSSANVGGDASTCDAGDASGDIDGDGIPDGCDPCPYDGPTAPSVPSSNGPVTNVALNGGSNVLTSLTPGQTFAVRVDYAFEDCACPSCIDQIQIGVVPNEPEFCAYNDVPGCSGEVTGSGNGMLTAPLTPGVYFVRWKLSQDFSCKTEWWLDQVPDATATIGAICVKD